LKKIKRKLTAFITTWVTLVSTSVLTIIFAPEMWEVYCQWFTVGLLLNAFGFICFTVIKDYIKAKHFNIDLFKGDK
jgi:hypothetical protein